MFRPYQHFRRSEDNNVIDSSHHELLAKVAAMYYEQDLTQNKIAEMLDLSRVKVYRLLKEAREAEVVKILIDYPIKRTSELEDELKQRFDLEHALVLQTTVTDSALLLRQIGQLAARYLEDILMDDTSMSICFGGTTYEVINAIRSDFQANITVIQATGSLSYALKEYDSSALTRQLAQKLGGEALYLSSPLMADNAEAATIIRNQAVVRRTLAQVRAADIALIGIGDLNPETSGFVRAGVADRELLESYRANGATGDMAWQIFDENGRLYPCEINERIIGITLDELRMIPLTLAVAVGTQKARAILGALKTGAINVLCTDHDTAQLILDL